MRIPPFDRFNRSVGVLGLLLAGGITGSALFTAVFHHNFTLLYLQNENLRAKNSELAQKVEALTRTKHTQTSIGMVTLHIDKTEDSPAIDAIVENKLKEKMAKDLNIVIGKPVSALKAAPLVYERLIDGQVYHQVQEKDYEVHVRRMMIIQSELIFWVTVKEFKRN
jgi:hypothetical protein